MTSKEMVLSVYPDAKCTRWPGNGLWIAERPGDSMVILGAGSSETSAWDDAASQTKLPSSLAGEMAVCAHCELPFKKCKCEPTKPLLTKWIPDFLGADISGPKGSGGAARIWIDPRTQEPCRRCDGTGKMPPWPGSKGLVTCGVCRETEVAASTCEHQWGDTRDDTVQVCKACLATRTVAVPIAPAAQDGKLNQYGLNPAEWSALVEIGNKLHDALMNEPEGEDYYDGQSMSIMAHLVEAFKAARAERKEGEAKHVYRNGRSILADVEAYRKSKEPSRG